MLKSIRAVFAFFFFLGKRARKFKGFILLGLLPVGLAVFAAIMLQGRSTDVRDVFTDILVAYDVQFLLVILSLFYGLSVCSEEVEGKTLPYLTTRPVSKTDIVIGKYAAYTALSATIVGLSLATSAVILSFDRLGTLAAWLALLRIEGVVVLGIAAYMAFFVFLGTVLKKSILFGLAFGFGWESVIQYFPGSTQRFSIMHYLKSLLPAGTTRAGKFSFLAFRLEPTPPLAAILTLVAIAAVFLILACFVWSRREYILED
jgi:ABC-2 type transport system permease protein